MKSDYSKLKKQIKEAKLTDAEIDSLIELLQTKLTWSE